MLEELKIDYGKPCQLQVNNKSTIDLSKNLVCHGKKSKHIETKYYFLRYQVRNKLS